MEIAYLGNTIMIHTHRSLKIHKLNKNPFVAVAQVLDGSFFPSQQGTTQHAKRDHTSMLTLVLVAAVGFCSRNTCSMAPIMCTVSLVTSKTASGTPRPNKSPVRIMNTGVVMS